MTPADREAQTRRVAELQRIRASEADQQHAAAARRAQEIWDQSAPATRDFPYLQTKKIQPHDSRVDAQGRLIVPVRIDGHITSLQTIAVDGTKRFLPGGKIKGGFFSFGNPKKGGTLIICEGFATGASLHEVTGFTVACAFSANNLKPVAEQFRRQFPAATILIAGDFDARDDGTPNVGLDAATSAADAVRGIGVMPDLGGEKCDWSDVYLQCGPEVVRRAVDAAVSRKGLPPPTVGEPITATLKKNEDESPLRVQADAIDTRDAISIADEWPKLDEAAFDGLPGELTKAVEPFSEADPAGILLHSILAAGVLIGSQPHVLVEHLPHFSRTNLLVVGLTASGRKGTALSSIRHILSRIDPSFIATRVKSGLSSAEGLIYQVRDAQYEKEPIRAAGHRTSEILGYQDRLVDPGEPDKRLLIVESEFASALTVMEREGNTLSPTLRDSWDSGNLSPLTKKDRMISTKAHIGVIAISRKMNYLGNFRPQTGRMGSRIVFSLRSCGNRNFFPRGRGLPHTFLNRTSRAFRARWSARKHAEKCAATRKLNNCGLLSTGVCRKSPKG